MIDPAFVLSVEALPSCLQDLLDLGDESQVPDSRSASRVLGNGLQLYVGCFFFPGEFSFAHSCTSKLNGNPMLFFDTVVAPHNAS